HRGAVRDLCDAGHQARYQASLSGCDQRRARALQAAAVLKILQRRDRRTADQHPVHRRPRLEGRFLASLTPREICRRASLYGRDKPPSSRGVHAACRSACACRYARRSSMRRISLVVAAAMAASAGVAAAQSYPSRPITVIVPFGAGGPADTLGRIVSEGMRAALGQSVVIENVTGASGTIGVGRVARAAPDGYTIGLGNWPTHVVNGAIYALPYDLLQDFAPVARLSSNPYVTVTRKDLPAQDLAGLIAWLKANPDKATEGTSGPGGGH